MKIEIFRATPLITIDEFADANNLIMEIHERDNPYLELMRFYAMFKNVEVLENGMLKSNHGNGSTHDYAIEEYQRKIAGKELIYNSRSNDRRSIYAPKEFRTRKE